MTQLCIRNYLCAAASILAALALAMPPGAEANHFPDSWATNLGDQCLETTVENRSPFSCLNRPAAQVWVELNENDRNRGTIHVAGRYGKDNDLTVASVSAYAAAVDDSGGVTLGDPLVPDVTDECNESLSPMWCNPDKCNKATLTTAVCNAGIDRWWNTDYWLRDVEIESGDGDDTISLDGTFDLRLIKVSCGSGHDTVYTNEWQYVAIADDCEEVHPGH